MPSEPALIVDDASALARRVRQLLERAGLEVASEPRSGARVLLVDPGRAQLERAVQAGARHLVHVVQAGDVRAGRSELFAVDARAAFRVSAVRTQPYFESLLPRLALALATGRFPSAAQHARAAYVAHEDAALAAAALVSSDLQGSASFQITGAVALSHGEICSVASELFGRSIVLEEVAAEQLAAELVQRGMGASEAARCAREEQQLVRAQPGPPSRDLAQITGIAALSLTNVLTQQRDSLQRAAAHWGRGVSSPFSHVGSNACAPASAL